MGSMERGDDYRKRRQHLRHMSDEELRDHFWLLVDRMVQPIVEEARPHTSPSIERSILLRMGFSSLETKPIVSKMMEKGLLGHGAGNLVLRLSKKKGISVREAGLALIRDEFWEELPL